MEDKWASVMPSPFFRKHTPLKFDMHFDEREVLFLLHNMLVHTICLSQAPREKKRGNAVLPGRLDLVSQGDLQCTSFSLSEGLITKNVSYKKAFVSTYK